MTSLARTLLWTLAIALVVAGGSPSSTHSARAEERRAGKVVRVERPRLSRRAPVLLCPMPFSEKNRGVCYGRPPLVGDTATLFDFDRHYIGRLRVTWVGSSQSNPCDSDTAFDFTYDYIDRVATGSRRGLLFSIAAFGIDVDPAQAQLITDNKQLPSPGDNSQSQPWMGMDRDGDGGADLVVTVFECSAIAPIKRPAGSGNNHQTLCLDYWLSDSGQFRKERRDYVHTCM